MPGLKFGLWWRKLLQRFAQRKLLGCDLAYHMHFLILKLLHLLQKYSTLADHFQLNNTGSVILYFSLFIQWICFSLAQEFQRCQYKTILNHQLSLKSILGAWKVREDWIYPFQSSFSIDARFLTSLKLNFERAGQHEFRILPFVSKKVCRLQSFYTSLPAILSSL